MLSRSDERFRLRARMTSHEVEFSIRCLNSPHEKFAYCDVVFRQITLSTCLTLYTVHSTHMHFVIQFTEPWTFLQSYVARHYGVTIGHYYGQLMPAAHASSQLSLASICTLQSARATR